MQLARADGDRGLLRHQRAVMGFAVGQAQHADMGGACLVQTMGSGIAHAAQSRIDLIGHGLLGLASEVFAAVGRQGTGFGHAHDHGLNQLAVDRLDCQDAVDVSNHPFQDGARRQCAALGMFLEQGHGFVCGLFEGDQPPTGERCSGGGCWSSGSRTDPAARTDS